MKLAKGVHLIYIIHENWMAGFCEFELKDKSSEKNVLYYTAKALAGEIAAGIKSGRSVVHSEFVQLDLSAP